MKNWQMLHKESRKLKAAIIQHCCTLQQSKEALQKLVDYRNRLRDTAPSLGRR